MTSRATFVIDPDASRLSLEAHTTLLSIRVGAAGIEGEMEVPFTEDGRVDHAAQPGGAMSFEVQRLERANPLYALEIAHLLDSANHPVVVVDLARAEPIDGGDEYRAFGSITLRGVTRPLDGELVVTFPHDEVLELAGEKVVDVREFGIEPPHLLVFRVDPEVRVRIEVLARRAG